MKGMICLFALFAWVAAAQETSKSEPAGKPAPSQEELEAGFKKTFTKATMSGRWAPLEEGKLGQEKKDRYNITSVSKVGKDLWLMNARVQYGGNELTIPVPIQVKWAGDTAVIVVDKFAMPGNTSTYSARVLVYNNTYAGNWSGEDHGGMLYGVITQGSGDQSKQ
ncbi:MAG TPA: hypothetical protein VJ063_14290 [Verrucomicrobiae bacterium]|nr:hypothetical protein [Verrucomicrobiae bacterium]